jgi:hypothetical protein
MQKPKRKLSFEESVKPLPNRILEFYTKISISLNHSRNAKGPLLSLCLNEKEIIELLYPNKDTQHNCFSKYRRHSMLAQIPLPFKTIILDTLKLSSSDSDARSLNRDLRIDIKTNNVALFDMMPFINSCKNFLLESHDPYTLVVGIMGLTGRRPIEVLKTASFERVNPHHLLFSGQAKTKNSPNSRHSFIIPVLADPDLIIEALSYIRTLIPVSSWENDLISSTINSSLLKRVRLLEHCISSNEHLSLNCRSLRAIYVASAYELFNMSTKASYNAFTARVLGHSHLDKNTANCYTYYAIRSPSSKKNPYPEFIGDIQNDH